MNLCIKLTNPKCLPTKPHLTDAGFDLVANSIIRSYSHNNYQEELNLFEFDKYVIPPGYRILVGTGIKIDLPVGYYAEVVSRSGLSLKSGVFVINSPGIIDSDYRGEVCVILMNLTDKHYELERFSRIAQLLIHKLEKINLITSEELSHTNRGSNGFGSSGVK